MSAHLEKTPTPLLQIDPSLPPALNAVVLMSIEKDPARRFQSADAFRTALLSVVPKLAAASPAASHPVSPVASPAASPAAAPAQGQPAVPRTAPAPPPPPAASTPFPVTVTPASVAPQAPAKPGGHRGRYLVLGSVVTLAVLVVAGTQAPKWLHKDHYDASHLHTVERSGASAFAGFERAIDRTAARSAAAVATFADTCSRSKPKQSHPGSKKSSRVRSQAGINVRSQTSLHRPLRPYRNPSPRSSNLRHLRQLR